MCRAVPGTRQPRQPFVFGFASAEHRVRSPLEGAVKRDILFDGVLLLDLAQRTIPPVAARHVRVRTSPHYVLVAPHLSARVLLSASFVVPIPDPTCRSLSNQTDPTFDCKIATLPQLLRLSLAARPVGTRLRAKTATLSETQP